VTAQNSTRSAKRRGRPFAKGRSGNPGGRPKDLEGVRALAKSYTVEAIDTLAKVMRKGPTEGARIRAAEALLDRAWGKASQAVELSGPEGKPIEVSDAREKLAAKLEALAAHGARERAAEPADIREARAALDAKLAALGRPPENC
jgi:hypothetical protein